MPIEMVQEIMGVLNKALGGYPIGLLSDFCTHLLESSTSPTDFIDMLSLNIVIDVDNQKIFSKYYKHLMPGEYCITEPNQVLVYLEQNISRSYI